MKIKEIILNGGSVAFPYNEMKKDFIGEAKIWGYAGGWGIKPKIVVEIPTATIKGRKEFPIEEIDEAVDLFKRMIFSFNNLRYKDFEARLKTAEKFGIEFNLEDEDVNEYHETERRKLIGEPPVAVQYTSKCGMEHVGPWCNTCEVQKKCELYFMSKVKNK